MSSAAPAISALSLREALCRARELIESATIESEETQIAGQVMGVLDHALGTLSPALLQQVTLKLPRSRLHVLDFLEASRREQERREATQNFNQVLLEALLQHSPHGILVSDKTGQIILQNRAAETIWGGSATTGSAEDWGKYRAYHPDGRPYEPEDWHMAKCLDERRAIDCGHVHFQRFDGTHGVLLGSCAPLIGADGELMGAISVFADITELKNSERALAQAVRERETLLAIVSHDLKSPLSALLCGVQVLEQPGAPVQRVASSLKRAATHMNSIVSDLMDLTQLELGKLKVDARPTIVGELLEDAAATMEPLASRSGISLEISESCELKALADRRRILQVLNNLIGNSIKHTPPGGSIRLRAAPAGSTIRFEVTDSGNGIAPEDLPHVFDRYWQSPGEKRNGVGLGLAICHGIIEKHGGTIDASSTLGVGSTFGFTLPLTETAPTSDRRS